MFLMSPVMLQAWNSLQDLSNRQKPWSSSNNWSGSRRTGLPKRFMTEMVSARGSAERDEPMMLCCCCKSQQILRWNVTIIPLHGQQVLCLLEATVIRQPCLLSCVTYWKHLSKMWIWSAVQFLRLESKSVWLGGGWKYLSGWKGTVYLEVLVWRREDSETQWLGRERMSQAGVEEGCVKDWMSSPSCGVLWGAFVWGGLEKVAVPDIPFSSERPRLVTSLSQDLSFMIEEQGQTQPGPRLTGITKSYLRAAWVAYMQPGSQ